MYAGGPRRLGFEYNMPGTCAGLAKRASKMFLQSDRTVTKRAGTRCVDAAQAPVHQAQWTVYGRYIYRHTGARRTFVGTRIGLGIIGFVVGSYRTVSGDRWRHRRD